MTVQLRDLTIQYGRFVAVKGVTAEFPRGSVGLLGGDHPGYYPVGNEGALARVLARCERDPKFLAALDRRGRRLAPKFRPEREQRAWRRLLAGLKTGRR